MPQTNAMYSVKSWDRKPWDSKPTGEVTDAKLARVEMIHVYKGGIEGEGTIQYLLADHADGKGGFVALEKVTGRVGGRSGSFVFQLTGTFDNGTIKEILVVVPGSGTDDLRDLSGQATFAGDQHQESYPIILDYAL